ncbi:MAG: hypothetical protein M5U28_11655 [Sandaracinaceae bacterium]|nr:hypothetical protein [Sandaracinaceae bacterium]
MGGARGHERTERADPRAGEAGASAPEVREHERDWWFHCSHHVSPYDKREQKNRHAFGRTYVDKEGRPVTVIDVVPNFAKSNSLIKKSDPAEDDVAFLWKDTELGSPPKPELFLTTTGKPEEKVAPAGNESATPSTPSRRRTSATRTSSSSSSLPSGGSSTRRRSTA